MIAAETASSRARRSLPEGRRAAPLVQATRDGRRDASFPPGNPDERASANALGHGENVAGVPIPRTLECESDEDAERRSVRDGVKSPGSPQLRRGSRATGAIRLAAEVSGM